MFAKKQPSRSRNKHLEFNELASVGRQLHH